MIISIIGHGRSPEGQGWGEAIDRSDVVIRMWDWEWQPVKDYGRKYNYGLFTVHPSDMPVFNKAIQSKKSPVASPKDAWLGYALAAGPVTPVNTIFVYPERYILQARSLGGASLGDNLHLTRGAVAVLWAIEAYGTGSKYYAPDTTIVLVGFDNLFAGKLLPFDEAFSPAYQEVYFSHKPVNRTKSYLAGATKTTTHDIAIERQVISVVADLHKVGVIAASDDIW